MTAKLLFLIPLLPLFCGVANVLFGMRLPRRLAVALAVGGVAASALLTLLAWPLAAGEGTRATLFTWLASGPVRIDFDSRGRQTLFTLLAQIERAEMRAVDVPPPELVVRRSTGPAPA